MNGEWTYTLDHNKADSLNEGQQVTDTFTVKATDGTTQDIVVNITGSDDAAVLSGTTTGTINNLTPSTQNVSISRDSDGTWDVSEGNNLYLNISNVGSDAAYNNSVGYYVLDANGNVLRAAILFDNAHNTSGTSVNINTSGGEKVGLFMIPDGDTKGFNTGSVSLSFSSGGVTAYQGGASGTAFVSESSKMAASIMNTTLAPTQPGKILPAAVIATLTMQRFMSLHRNTKPSQSRRAVIFLCRT